LGLTVQEHLSWRPHKEDLQKLRISYDVVKKASPFLSTHGLHMLYYSMIQSHFSYYISSWCHGNKTTLIKLQRIANKFIRMIFNLDYKANVNKVMQINGLLTIEQLSQLETACFMFKYQKKTLPTIFNNFLDNNLTRLSSNKSGLQTRNRNSTYYSELLSNKCNQTVSKL